MDRKRKSQKKDSDIDTSVRDGEEFSRDHLGNRDGFLKTQSKTKP